MRKSIIIVFVLIGLFSLSSAVVLYNSRDQAVSALESFKTQREGDINKGVNSITFVTDKICYPSYNDPSQSNCYICFTFDDDRLGEMCVNLNPGTDYDQDLEIIEREARDRIGNLYPIERFEYKEYDKQGVVLNV